MYQRDVDGPRKKHDDGGVGDASLKLAQFSYGRIRVRPRPKQIQHIVAEQEALTDVHIDAVEGCEGRCLRW